MVYKTEKAFTIPTYTPAPRAEKKLVGADIFLHYSDRNPNELADKVKKLEGNDYKLSMITNRGIKVWPDGFSQTFCTDHWRCRFKPVEGKTFSKENIISLLQDAQKHGFDVIKTENLYEFNGKPGYSLGQGQ